MARATTIIDAPQVRIYGDAAFVPAHEVTTEERRQHKLLAPAAWIGGVIDKTGNSIADSRLTRRDIEIMAAIDAPLNTETMNEHVIYGGFLFPNHFGHFVIETMARLWYAAFDDTKRYVFHAPPHQAASLSEMNRIMFAAAGLKDSQIWSPGEPTRFRSIAVPAPATEVRSHKIFAEQRAIYERISESLLPDLPPRKPNAAYFSRARLSDRLIEDEAEIEAYACDLGCDIIYPETHSIPEQIEIINSYSTVVGFIGSAFHSLVFSRRPVTAVYLERTAREHSNLATFQAIDNLCGHEGIYVECANGQSDGKFVIDRPSAKTALDTTLHRTNDPCGRSEA